MKKIIYLFVILILFNGCTITIKKSNNAPKKKKQAKTIELPAWFWELPNNNCVIGISYFENDVHRMIEAAKQDAAIQMTKSKSAIIISKRASIDTFDESNEKIREVDYDVVGNKKLLRKNYNELSLIESTIIFNNYYIALFSTKPVKNLNNKIVSNFDKTKPDWFRNKGLVTKNNNVFFYSKASSSSLDNAFNKCLQKGRMSIGRYLKKEIKAMDKDTNNFTKRVFSQETIKRLNNITYLKNFVTYSKIDGKMKYTVFMKIGVF